MPQNPSYLNYAATYYKVGLLFPLWSIGIEEQFYFFWAPLVRFCRNRIFPLLLTAMIITTAFYCVVAFALESRLDSALVAFLLTIKFHNC